MNIILSLVVFAFLLNFSSAQIVGVLRVICFEDETSTVSKHEFQRDGSGAVVGVTVQERFHIDIQKDEIEGNLITLTENKVWHKIVGDKAKDIRSPVNAALLKTILKEGKGTRLIDSVSDMGLATGATMIYQEGNENSPDSVKYFDVEVTKIESHLVVFGPNNYTVHLRIVDPAPSPDKLKLVLLNHPVENGIHPNDADAVLGQFGKEVIGYPVTFKDMNGTPLQNKWNKKMYFVKIPLLLNTYEDLNKGRMKGKFSQPLLFRLGVGGAGKVIGEEDGQPDLKVMHEFTDAGQAGFLVAGKCAVPA